MRKADGAWVGWAGQPDLEVEPFEFDGTHSSRSRSSAEESSSTTRASRTTRSGRSITTSSPRRATAACGGTRTSRVNRRFAEAAAAAAAEGATVWVQDYQLQLVPRMLRESRPDLTIGYFHHIPFPAYGLYSQLPWRRQVLEGLLGADVIGFQRVADAGNFARAVRRQLRLRDARRRASGARTTTARRRRVAREGVPDLDRRVVVHRARPARRVKERARRRSARASATRRRILLGVDRLDYTKGIRHRLKALRRAARRGPAQRRGRHARAGREPEPRARRGLHRSCATRSS